MCLKAGHTSTVVGAVSSEQTTHKASFDRVTTSAAVSSGVSYSDVNAVISLQRLRLAASFGENLYL